MYKAGLSIFILLYLQYFLTNKLDKVNGIDCALIYFLHHMDHCPLAVLYRAGWSQLLLVVLMLGLRSVLLGGEDLRVKHLQAKRTQSHVINCNAVGTHYNVCHPLIFGPEEANPAFLCFLNHRIDHLYFHVEFWVDTSYLRIKVGYPELVIGLEDSTLRYLIFLVRLKFDEIFELIGIILFILALNLQVDLKLPDSLANELILMFSFFCFLRDVC